MPEDIFALRNAMLDRAASVRGFGNLGSPTISAAGAVPYQGVASSLNSFMTGQARAPFEANLPDYESMVAQRSKNTGAQLRGQVPDDVVNQILQNASERGIMTGSPGGPNSNAAFLRALGLTSIGQQEAGSRSLSQSIADTPVPQLFNPASLFVPEHLAGLELRAAQAGMGAGRGGGYGGGGQVINPGPGSPMRLPSAAPNYANPTGTFGRIGYFDETPAAPWSPNNSNMYGGGGWGDPNANIYQPAGYGFNDQYTGQDFMNEMYSDFGAVDWGNDYSPFGSNPAPDYGGNYDFYG